jgi:signal transduction histidine kinase
MTFENRVQALFVKETYQRTLAGPFFILFLTVVVMTYQYNSPQLGPPFIYLGCALCVVLMIRATISYLGLNGKISSFAYLPHLKAALTVNALIWGIVFCLDAWYAKIEGIERFIAFSIMIGITGASPTALVTVPNIQRLLYFTVLLAPGSVYFYRIAIGELPTSFLPVPSALVLFSIYNVVSGRKLLEMLTQSIENTLKLEMEQENLRATLEQLKVTQTDLMNERAKSLNSERLTFLGTMASGVAHEINNPLTISGGQVFKIQNLLSADPSRENSTKIGQAIEKITDMNGRIRNIVRGLQYFSRERKPEAAEVFCLTDLIELSSTFLNERLKSHEIQADFEAPPSVFIHGQKNELSQALFNIIDNAIQAVQTVPDRRVSIRYEVTNDHLKITISDNGCGINPEIRDRVFDPFFTTKDVGQGTGLGLSVARGIAQSHGGTLTFTSTPGNTVFIMTLPVAVGNSLNEKPDNDHAAA